MKHIRLTSSARPLTDLDFSSGSRVEEINKLLVELERRECSHLQGKDILQSCVQAKDLIFSLTAQIYPLPSPNSLLLLSGGLCSGFLDVSPSDLGSSSPFVAPCISYTLLVPIIRLPSPDLILRSSPCHFLLPPSLWDPPNPELSPTSPSVTPHDVSSWFIPSFLSLVSHFSESFPHLSLEKAEPWGNCVSVLLSKPSSLLIRFDIVPVVEVQGWPPGFQCPDDWVGLPLTQEDCVFHLFPWGANGQWRVGFPGVELYIRRYLPQALSRVLRASMAVLGPILLELGAPGPYVVWVTLLHAYERLPQGYLGQEDNAASCFLGILEELSLSLLRGSCPNPFLPGCDLLSGSTHGPCLARWVSEVRVQPVYHLRDAVRGAKDAVKVGEKVESDEEKERV
ncbi:transmembrane protein 102-like [Pseudophryne corroboree]|uniref:transmembrane protein 102-like n=1 Tax=Pseudophryne corroboree TaxID=495146 RepID=UPI00308138D2